MPRLVSGLVLALVVLALPHAVLATGRSGTPLSACLGTPPTRDLYGDGTAQGYRGGVKLYAGDRWSGQSRVLCPETFDKYWPEHVVHGTAWDFDLGTRRGPGPRLIDVWRGFRSEVESLRIGADAGCVVVVRGSAGGALDNPAVDRIHFRLDNTRRDHPRVVSKELKPAKDDELRHLQVRVTCPDPEEP